MVKPSPLSRLWRSVCEDSRQERLSRRSARWRMCPTTRTGPGAGDTVAMENTILVLAQGQKTAEALKL